MCASINSSMTTTETQTKTAADVSTATILMTLTTRLYSKDEITDKLLEILTKYGHWKDETSRRLFKWGSKVLKITLIPENESAFQEKAKKKVINLFKNILVNPQLLGNLPLKSPVLINGKWTCEESDWNIYTELLKKLKLANREPFEGEPFESKIPHEFAREIIKLVKLLPKDFSGQYGESDQKEIQSTIAYDAHTHLNLIILSSLQAKGRADERSIRKAVLKKS